MDKDYTLLRPFDPEKAKAGEAICFKDGGLRNLISGPDKSGYVCILRDNGNFEVSPSYYCRMTPLSWLEGRPVYEGDEAYGKASGKKYAASKAGWYCDGSYYSLNEEEFAMLTWAKPAPKKIKRTVKYLAYEDLLGVVLHVREGVYVDRRWERLPEFDLSREIEEEVKP